MVTLTTQWHFQPGEHLPLPVQVKFTFIAVQAGTPWMSQNTILRMVTESDGHDFTADHEEVDGFPPVTEIVPTVQNSEGEWVTHFTEAGGQPQADTVIAFNGYQIGIK